MESLEQLIDLSAIVLFLWAFYIFARLAIAIWAPGKSDQKWISILEHPAVHPFRPFIKWLVPFCLLLMLASLILKGLAYLLL